MTKNTQDVKISGKNTTEKVDFDQILSELGSGGRVSVSRIEPDWCKGHVRTIQLNQSEPISIEWLSGKFGGEKLEVRVYAEPGKGVSAFRTVEICGCPRNGHGIELVRGPEGNAVPINRLEEEKRRYNLIHGISDPNIPAANTEVAQVPQQPFDMTQMFTALINQQNQSNSQLTQMLVNRIQHLEQMSIGAPQVVAGTPPEPADPLGNLRNTVDVIAQLEMVKEKMGIGEKEPANETSGYIDLIKAFMEIKLEGEKAKTAQLQAGQPPAPALPAGAQSAPLQNIQQPGPPPAPGTPPFQPNMEPSNDDLMKVAMERIQNMPRAERLNLASAVLGEPIDDSSNDDFEDEGNPSEVENKFPDGQEHQKALDLAYNDDETGEDHGSQDDRCSEPSHIQDPPENSAS